MKLSLSTIGTPKVEYTFKPGFNIIVGRNGYGKSCLLTEVKTYCEKHKIPFYKYDNYVDGGSVALGNSINSGSMFDFANLAFHSEGEQIFYNLGLQIRKIAKFLEDHKDKETFILLDAIDSGFDIDGIIQLKSIEKQILETNPNAKVLIAANNFELMYDKPCIDARTGEFIDLSTYDKFKSYILKQYEEARKENNKKKKKASRGDD